MPILLSKISTKGGGGQKSLKSCLVRRIRTAPNLILASNDERVFCEWMDSSNRQKYAENLLLL